MIDPIHAHLCMVLMQLDVIATEDVCWWDSARAEAACRAAGLRSVDVDTWIAGDDTAAWMQRTWDQIRRCA